MLANRIEVLLEFYLKKKKKTKLSYTFILDKKKIDILLTSPSGTPEGNTGS